LGGKSAVILSPETKLLKKLVAILSFLVLNQFSYAHCIISTDFYFRVMCNPRSIQFVYAGQNIASASWSFEDGSTFAGLVANHTYSAFGVYPVKLFIVGVDGCIDSTIKLVSIQAQFNNTFIFNNDTTICTGQGVQLNARLTGGLSSCWYSNTGFSSTSQQAMVSPVATTTYYYTSIFEGANLVNNGDFSAGNTGFLSNCIPMNPNSSSGQYWVGNNPNSWNPVFSNCIEHTTGSGNMMMISGMQFNSTTAWQQSFSIVPQTNYVFSFWTQALEANNSAPIRLSINNTTLTDTFYSGISSCNWKKYYVFWNSGDTNSVFLSISVNNITNLGQAFAIDDISFAEMITQQDSITVNVEQRPLLNSSPDTTVCESVPVQLYSNGASNYGWSPPVGLSNTAISNPIASPASSIEYIVAGYNLPGCVTYDTVRLNIIPKPAVTITGDTTICFKNQIHLLAAGGIKYQWSPSTGLSALNIPDPLASPLSSIMYKVKVEGTNGCFADDSVQITVAPLPIIQISKSGDIDCVSDQSHLNASGGNQYTWSPSQGLNNPAISNPTAKPIQTTIYHVLVTTLQGCINSDSIPVFVYPPGTEHYYLPNAFTPNNDGLNDCFGIKNWGTISQLEFSIFDRWGVRVFHTTNPGTCWNGSYKNILQPVGTYIYYIQAKSTCSGKIIRKGALTLLR
jgi:gliding motility-associated-like protein